MSLILKEEEPQTTRGYISPKPPSTAENAETARAAAQAELPEYLPTPVIFEEVDAPAYREAAEKEVREEPLPEIPSIETPKTPLRKQILHTEQDIATSARDLVDHVGAAHQRADQMIEDTVDRYLELKDYAQLRTYLHDLNELNENSSIAIIPSAVLEKIVKHIFDQVHADNQADMAQLIPELGKAGADFNNINTARQDTSAPRDPRLEWRNDDIPSRKVNGKEQKGFRTEPLLSFAINWNYSDLAKALILHGGKGVDLNMPRSTEHYPDTSTKWYHRLGGKKDHTLDIVCDKDTPLKIALKCKRRELAQLLIDNGADGRSSEYIEQALYKGYSDIARTLFDAAGELIKSDPKAYTGAFIAAAGMGNTELVEDFIKKGMPLEADCYGTTALIAAVTSDSKDTVGALIKAGANVNAQTDSGYTPFTYAVNRNKCDIAKMLLDAGADMNVMTQYGYSGYTLAMKSNSPDLIALVEEYAKATPATGVNEAREIARRGGKDTKSSHSGIPVSPEKFLYGNRSPFYNNQALYQK